METRTGIEQVQLEDLGQIDYKEAWDLQESLLRVNVGLKLSAGRQAKPHSIPTQHRLLLCEHPHVYTLGKSGKESHVLIEEQQRNEKGISFYQINRGGDITYHGPGQITGYPILDLEKFKPDLGWYLRSLEEVMIRLLADYGLTGGRIPGATGVWLDIDSPLPRKICAFGIRCSRWISMHGFAFNVNTDLDYFRYIVPCGISDKDVTSLQRELGYEIEMSEVKSRLLSHFEAVFNCKMRTIQTAN